MEEKKMTKEQIIEAYKSWGGKEVDGVPNVWEVMGRLIMLKELPDGFCETIDL